MPFETPWDKSTQFSSLYFHLPFCKKICHYCDFYVVPSRVADHDRLFRAMYTQLKESLPYLKKPLVSIYFGGGTPSETPRHHIEELLSVLKKHMDKDTEITLEANPSSINEERILSWKNAGINRLSIGTQSLNDKLLKKLGREHNAREAIKSLEIAKKSFSNMNADLMYGVPDQKEDSLLLDAEILLEKGVTHISAYHLTLNKNHFLYAKTPSNDKAKKQILHLHKHLDKKSWEHYEISNFAKKNHESRHNQGYWNGNAYIAIGPSAHGFDGKYCRYQLLDNWKKYSEEILDNKSFPLKWKETLSQKSRTIEFLFTSLRCKKGIDFNKFKATFGYDLKEKQEKIFKEAQSQGWGTMEENNWIPSLKGILLADSITLKMI